MPSICHDSRRIPAHRSEGDRRSIVISEPYWIRRAVLEELRAQPTESESEIEVPEVQSEESALFENEKGLPILFRSPPAHSKPPVRHRRRRFILLAGLIAQLIFNPFFGFSNIFRSISSLSAAPAVVSSSLTPYAQSLVTNCSALAPLSPASYAKRLAALQTVLSANGSHDIYVTEPGASGEYYVKIGAKDWHLSERPFLIVVATPKVSISNFTTKSLSNATAPSVIILTPQFEADRARLLPVAGLNSSQVTFLEWPEASSPFATLVTYLNLTAETTIHVDPYVRSFITSSLTEEFEKTRVEGLKVAVAGKDILRIRERKSQEEIDFLECANKLTLEAMKATKNEMYIGIKESETAAILEKHLEEFGLVGGEGLVLFGENAALPHGTGTDKILTETDLILIDCGGKYHGYVSDITRTFALPASNISATQMRLFYTVVGAQVVAQGAVKVGATGASVDAAARGIIETRGKRPEEKQGFTHRLGHGIGLEGHEAPYLVGSNLEPLEIGNVFSNEPGIYILGELGIRLEDCFYVNEKGKGVFFTGPSWDINGL